MNHDFKNDYCKGCGTINYRPSEHDGKPICAICYTKKDEETYTFKDCIFNFENGVYPITGNYNKDFILHWLGHLCTFILILVFAGLFIGFILGMAWLVEFVGSFGLIGNISLVVVPVLSIILLSYFHEKDNYRP